MGELIALRDLAEEFGADRSGLRKFILANGINPQRARAVGTRGQAALVLTREQADEVRQLRAEAGDGEPAVTASATGLFYLVQLVPDLCPHRIKLGFAASMPARLAAHRTAAPTAQVVKTWPCRKSWEEAAIASVTREGCAAVGFEVFDCDSLPSVEARADEFFCLMPAP